LREKRERKRYNSTRLVKFPIEEGIEPVNWLKERSLKVVKMLLDTYLLQFLNVWKVVDEFIGDLSL